MKDKDGNLLTNDSETRKRWQEHFEEILIRPISDNPVSSEPNEHDEQVIEDISYVLTVFQMQKLEQQLERCKMEKSGGNNDNCRLAC